MDGPRGIGGGPGPSCPPPLPRPMYKVTIIWAPQWALKSRVVGGLTWGSGKRHELFSCPIWVHGGAPAASTFSYIQTKSELIFGHRCVNSLTVLWQIRDTKPKTGQRENSDFFQAVIKIGTVPENPGWMVTLK